MAVVSLPLALALAAFVPTLSSSPADDAAPMDVAPAPPLTPPMAVGTTRNDIVIAALSSSTPMAVAALRFQLPRTSPSDVAAVVAVMTAAALKVVGTEGLVEVAQRDDSVSIVCSMPTARAETAVRAIDAALRALRTPPKAPKADAPPTTPTLPPGVSLFDDGVDGINGGDVANWFAVPKETAGAMDATADLPVAEAFKALTAWLTAEHLAITVVGPGDADDLLRRSGALVSAPLARTTTNTPTTNTPTTTMDTATTTSTSSSSSTSTSSTNTTTSAAVRQGRAVVVMRAQRPNDAVARLALVVLADLIGGQSVGGWSDAPDAPWGLVSEGIGDGTMLTDVVIGVGQAPPPPDLVEDAARRQRLVAMARLDRVTRLADAVAAGILKGDAAAVFVELAALSSVTATDVSRAARACATGEVRVVVGTDDSAGDRSQPPRMAPVVRRPGVVIDDLDVLPVAVVAIPGDGPGAVMGPCGLRRMVVVARDELGAFVAGTTPVATTTRTLPTTTTTTAPPVVGGLRVPLVMQAGLFDDEGLVLALAADLALRKAAVPTTASTQLVMAQGRAWLQVSTPDQAATTVDAVGAALSRWSPDARTVTQLQSAAALTRGLAERVLGARALRLVDRQLCTPHAPPAEPTTAAVVRAALAAPVLVEPTPADGVGAPSAGQ